MQDIFNAIAKCIEEIHSEDCSGDEFDKLSAHIYKLIEKVIYRCYGRLNDARKLLKNEGLEEYLDLYLELAEQV